MELFGVPKPPVHCAGLLNRRHRQHGLLMLEDREEGRRKVAEDGNDKGVKKKVFILDHSWCVER